MTTDKVSKYSTQRPFVAVNLIFQNQDGKIALLLRKDTAWMNHYYSLPGGKVEADESIMDAAIREAKEEVSVNLNRGNLEHALTVHLNSNEEDADMKWVYEIFKVNTWDGELQNAEPEFHEELKWCDPVALPHNTIPSMQACLEAWMNNRRYFEYGW